DARAAARGARTVQVDAHAPAREEGGGSPEMAGIPEPAPGNSSRIRVAAAAAPAKPDDEHPGRPRHAASDTERPAAGGPRRATSDTERPSTGRPGEPTACAASCGTASAAARAAQLRRWRALTRAAVVGSPF